MEAKKDIGNIRNYAVFLCGSFWILFCSYLVLYLVKGLPLALFSSFFFLFFCIFSFHAAKAAKRLLE